MKPVIFIPPMIGIFRLSIFPSNPQYLNVLYPKAAFTDTLTPFKAVISASNEALNPFPYNGSFFMRCKYPFNFATPTSTFLKESLDSVNPLYSHFCR